MSLSGCSVAVLAYPGYQEIEFWYPVLRAREEGADVSVITSHSAGCESFLGYPVIGDAHAADVDVESLDALIVPGTVDGLPRASDEQRRLIKSADAAGRRVYASGTGAALVDQLVGHIDDDRVAANADAITDLVRRLCDDLSSKQQPGD